jgi:hypothetical protein
MGTLVLCLHTFLTESTILCEKKMIGTVRQMNMVLVWIGRLYWNEFDFREVGFVSGCDF